MSFVRIADIAFVIRESAVDELDIVGPVGEICAAVVSSVFIKEAVKKGRFVRTH